MFSVIQALGFRKFHSRVPLNKRFRLLAGRFVVVLRDGVLSPRDATEITYTCAAWGAAGALLSFSRHVHLLHPPKTSTLDWLRSSRSKELFNVAEAFKPPNLTICIVIRLLEKLLSFICGSNEKLGC